MIKKRVTFYVDGFNFYFGLKRTKKADPLWGRFYWIDMVKLLGSFLGEGQELAKVIYFTASPLSSDKNSRQSAFLNANKLINGDKFEIVRGKYLEKHIICPFCKGDIIRPEEKKTDVKYPEKHIKVYFPPSNYSNDLKDNMLHHRSRPVLMIANPYRFRQAVMPDEVTDGEKRYTIPEKWKYNI